MVRKLFLIVTILGMLIVNLVSADIIPLGSHPVSRCVKFVNLDEFPDVVLIGYYTGPMIETYEAYQIQNDVCLKKGYKFNLLDIYWTTREKFDVLDIQSLNPDDLTLLLDNVEPYGGYVDAKNPLKKETIEYSIARFNGSLIAYKSKQISEYNNGQPMKVEIFDKPDVNDVNDKEPTNASQSEPVPTLKLGTFWDKFLSFFKRLFWGRC